MRAPRPLPRRGAWRSPSHGLPARSPDRREERKGPRVGAPETAIDGFLKAAGLNSIDRGEDPARQEGRFLHRRRPSGRAARRRVIAEIVPGIVRAFPWPKSMRWGAASAKPGRCAGFARSTRSSAPSARRPRSPSRRLRRRRHPRRQHHPRPPLHGAGADQVRRFDDYVAKLEKAKVVLDADRRKDIILADARRTSRWRGLELVEDEGLLEEVAGLVEWPVVLVGAFDEAFLDIPPEVIRATIRANQKCFVLRDPATGTRSPTSFILVANIEASDGGKAIVAGNERVIRARLADAHSSGRPT